ncbi:hypothetical protein V8G54_008844 [Vigna mungo]|uniref:Protein At-4/1 n=1 Tax=Vigna mungo TaxID=3915 RepID=A0AAQ3P6A6_VIGMU
MAATSDEEMESLLSAFDQIYEDAKSSISEMQLLQSNYNAELKMRESLQVASNALKSGSVAEKDRLAKLYSESLKNLADQLDYRTNCLILKEELERAKTEVSLKEDGYRKDTGLLKREYEQQISCLEAQVKESLHEKATYEATISQLHGDLAAHKSHMQVIAMRLDQLNVEVESKCEALCLPVNAWIFFASKLRYIYMCVMWAEDLFVLFNINHLTDNSEIQDLKECLAVEQEEKNELNRKIQNLEKESYFRLILPKNKWEAFLNPAVLICKAKLVDQQQEMTANWHVETLKQKIMKLRKENEVLKRKLSHSEEGK